MPDDNQNIEKSSALKDYEMIGCHEARGKVELYKISDYFSDHCLQSCPNWNLCQQITNSS